MVLWSCTTILRTFVYIYIYIYIYIGPSWHSPPSYILCKEAGRQSGHFLSKCPHLPVTDKRFFAKARAIAALDEELSGLEVTDDDNPDTLQSKPPTSCHVQVSSLPFLNAFYTHHSLKVTIDSCTETNMIKTSITNQIGAHILKSSQLALQVDSQSSLTVIGETKLTLTRDNHTFFLEALVVDNVDADILVRVPFMTHNDITVCPAKHQIVLSHNTVYCYVQKLMQTAHTLSV